MTTIIIPLTKGYETVIDESDAHLARFSWCVCHTKCGFYAKRGVRSGGKQWTVLMHREIMSPPDWLEVDHKDRNKLNNRRHNLRICTSRQNKANRPPVSGYKGVNWDRSRSRWLSRCDGKNLGRFPTEIEAAHAYDTAAFVAFGEFAYLNRDHFPL